MRKILVTSIVFCLFAGVAATQAKPVQLHHVQFPEKTVVPLEFAATSIAPAARVRAEVFYKKGQARVIMDYEKMKPAILFGGDVTCFVVWAITRDGDAENLGELLTRKMGGKIEYQTGKKGFAILITAEAFYLVTKPSELVVFHNLPPIESGENAPASPFVFDRLAAAPRHHMDGIAHIKWDSNVPLELLQARKAFELASENEAAVHASQIYGDAQKALAEANEYAVNSPKSRELLDAARVAVALSNEALNIALHRVQAIEVERQLQLRKQETAALESRATEAEAAAKTADRFSEEVRREASLIREEANQLREEKARVVIETAALRAEKQDLEQNMLALRQEKSGIEFDALQLSREKDALASESQRLASEKSALEAEASRLRSEKLEIESRATGLQSERDELSGRLQNALSHVADAQESARGWVINLPDILFDTNEAELKPEAQTIVAKLSGILLVLSNQDVVVEGHTDSTGSADYNRDLSERRAGAVRQFMQSQGLESNRLTSAGFGMDRPVSDNDSDEGRRKNRRVEILIRERGQAVAKQ